MATILVAGGTGLLGSAITQALIDKGHDVRVMTRNPASVARRWDGKVDAVEGDVKRPETLSAAMEGVHVAVDAVQFPNMPIEDPKKGFTFKAVDLEGTKALVDAATGAGVGQFIGLSGAGAAEHAKYHWLRYKWQEEQYIAASGVPYVIFRPSWIYGPDDVSLNRFLGFAKFLPFVPIIGNGNAIRINPLFVDDIGKHAAAAVQNDAVMNRIFEIGGPQVLTMNEVVQTALKVMGKRRFLLPQPKFLMKPVAAIVQHVPGRPLTPDAIDFITSDGVVDTTALQEAFGLRLTPLEEGLRTYLPR